MISDTAAQAQDLTAVTTRGARSRFFRQARQQPQFLIALALFLVFVLTAVLADQLAPHAYDSLDLRNRIKPPSTATTHLLGTDALGRDVLSQIIYGIRTSLMLAGAATVVAALVGSAAGALAGYFGGWFDAGLMRLVDMQLAIPAFFIALAGAVVIGRSLIGLTAVLVLVSWAQFARTARASALAVREESFVEAARGLGATSLRINFTHVLPNIVAPLLILFSISLPHAIMVEASLSFVGMGLPAGVPSLGSIINDGYAHLLAGAWWISILPGVALMLIVLSINTITDGLRDILDTRL